MIKTLGAFFIVFTFTMYSFAHGTCSSFEADTSKCEATSFEKVNCEHDSNSSNHNPESEQSSVHSCGCVNVFLHNSLYFVMVINEDSNSFSTAVKNYQEVFLNRIEKPPIS